MGIRRTEASFKGVGGLSLFRRAWIPESPERLVLLIHGFAEHSGRYDELGAWFAERGSAVHAFDLRGHGRSEGHRNHVERFDCFLDDADHFLELAGAEHSGLHRTLIGHSMGGLIVSALARERSPAIDALVTSGAALSAPSMSRTKEWSARVLRRVRPTLSLASRLPADALSRDPAVVARYLEDPLITTEATVSLGAEMLAAARRTAGGGAEVGVPMLLLHGGDDPLCAPSGSEAFFASLGPVSDRSGLRVYPGLRHEIFNEPERLEIFDEVLMWIRARECERLQESSAAPLTVSGEGR
jgi:alpha-beta hydrolase superfamily lysophospholipase